MLEIGLLGGYSTMWLARAIGPKGKLVTLEVDELCVRVARKNLRRAGLLPRVDIRHGDARLTLKQMVRNRERPFDLVFIDADKPSYSIYLDYALKLTRPGSLILADNVIRDGKVARSAKGDELVEGIKKFNKKLAANRKLEAIFVTVMRKRIDGLAIARVKGLTDQVRLEGHAPSWPPVTEPNAGRTNPPRLRANDGTRHPSPWRGASFRTPSGLPGGAGVGSAGDALSAI